VKGTVCRGARATAFAWACASPLVTTGCVADSFGPHPPGAESGPGSGPPVTEPVGASPPRDVLVVEKIDCHAEGGAAMLFLRGVHVAGEGAMDEVRVRLAERMFARYRPERAGIDSTDWYCIPRRRLCYSSIAFSDYRGTNRAGDVVAARPTDVFDARDESVPSLAAHEYASRCK